MINQNPIPEQILQKTLSPLNSNIQPQNILSLYLLKARLESQLRSQFLLNDIYRVVMENKQNQINDSPKIKIQQTDQINDLESNKKQKLIRKVKNDTKNIPKNFGKAIITFIEKNQKLVTKTLDLYNIDYEDYVHQLQERKKDLNSIATLRSIWIDQEFKYAKATRIISQYFLKRISFKYIFGSRVANYEGHIKYRSRLLEALENPKEFTRIKIY